MRRQTATGGINPAGSSRALRLDPLSLPVSFDAQRQPRRRRRAAVSNSPRARRAAPCRPRHADGHQRPRQRLLRRHAARLEDDCRCWCSCIGIRRLTHSARASVPTAEEIAAPGRCGARSSRCRNCRNERSLREPAPRRRRRNAITRAPSEIPGARRPARRATGDITARGCAASSRASARSISRGI